MTVTHPEKVYARLHEFAAHLVDGPVGIGKQQHRRVFVSQFLPEDVEHGKRSLAGAWRSDYEEDVTGLHCPLHQ